MWGRLLLAFAIGGCAMGGADPSAESIEESGEAIRDGWVVEDPLTVQVFDYDNKVGSGYLICGRAVLTAGHVAKDPPLGPLQPVRTQPFVEASYRLDVGSYRSASASRYDHVSMATGRDDIGILLLDRAVQYRAGTALGLAQENLPRVGEHALFRGYGFYVSTQGMPSEREGTLRGGRARFAGFGQPTWGSAAGALVFDPLVHTDGTAPLPCHGDSGGPVFHSDGWLIGVVSSVQSAGDPLTFCRDATRMFAAPLHAHRDWLQRHREAYCNPSSLTVQLKDGGFSTVAVSFTAGRGLARNAPPGGTAGSQSFATTVLLAGDRATLVPSPNTDKVFKQWSGERCPCTSAAITPSCSFDVAGATAYDCTAEFGAIAPDDDDDDFHDDDDTTPPPSPGDPPAPPLDPPPNDPPPMTPPEEDLGDDDDDASNVVAPPPTPDAGYCGDAFCAEDELYTDCADCAYVPPPSFCGDGYCDLGEPIECVDCATPATCTDRDRDGEVVEGCVEEAAP